MRSSGLSWIRLPFPSSLPGAERLRRSGCPILASRRAVALALALLSLAAHAASTRFVILSDTHPARGAEPQLALLQAQLITLAPEFVIHLGDFEGGGALPGWMPGAESSLQLFHALREAGIEVYPVIGNHDLGGRKHEFICDHRPPLNPEFDAELNAAVHDRWCGARKYWYSFERAGIRFVVLDSNLNAGHPGFEEQLAWFEDELCPADSSYRTPTVLLMHDVGYFGCDTRSNPGTVYHRLARMPDHPVVAAFGGHWHSGQAFPPENNLGVLVYATEASVHLVVDDPEYIVATVGEDRVTFDTVDTKTGGPGKTGLVYLPIRTASRPPK